MDESEKERPAIDGEVWVPSKTASKKPADAKSSRRNPIWNPANRRNSREWALQILFQADANPPRDGIASAIADFWEMQSVEGTPPEKKLKDFTEKLVLGAWGHRDEIDAKISSYLENWTIDRIGMVDRNVMRLAMFELFFSDETPPVVIVNEAVDVAKFFSTRDTGRFVNGILNRAMKDVKRSHRDAVKPPWLRKSGK